MARTAVAYSVALYNNKLADPAGTSISSGAGNGGQVASAWPEQTLLRVVATTAGNLTVKAGTYPLSIAASQGDLAVAITGSATTWVGPFDSSRFTQADGSLVFESDQTFTVTAFKFPRH